MRILRTILLAGLLPGMAACGDAGGDGAASAPAATPGAAVTVGAVLAAPAAGIVTVAWTFDLADGWHLYGPGLNDSGYPPSVQLDLPAGWTAGSLRWPVPERLLLSGGILDHVYHHRLVLLQDLVPPGGARPDTATTLPAVLRWLACREACVPGQAAVAVTIPGKDAPLPVALPALPAFPEPLPAGLVNLARSGDTLTIAVAGARALRFFPDQGSGPYLDLAADGEAAGGRLALRLRGRDGDPAVVRGLLQVQQTDGTLLTGPIDAAEAHDADHIPGG